MATRKGEVDPKFVTIGFPQALVEEVDRFIAEHPELGIMGRAEFARQALGDRLRSLREYVYAREVEEEKKGKPGPVAEMERLKKRVN